MPQPSQSSYHASHSSASQSTYKPGSSLSRPATYSTIQYSKGHSTPQTEGSSPSETAPSSLPENIGDSLIQDDTPSTADDADRSVLYFYFLLNLFFANNNRHILHMAKCR